MKELDITPNELKQLIDKSKIIGEGIHITIFEYGSDLIKLDSTLYNLLRYNSENCAERQYRSHYSLDNEDTHNETYREFRSLVNPRQIERLVAKKDNIILSQLPKGIVKLGDFFPGTIIPYHKEHLDLSELPRSDHKLLLEILKKLLLSIKELADNKIAHHDLVHYNVYAPHRRGYNVLYKDNTPQIIDFDSRFNIKCDATDGDLVQMYNQFGDLVLEYFYINGLTASKKIYDITDEKNAESLINELEGKIIYSKKYH